MLPPDAPATSSTAGSGSGGSSALVVPGRKLKVLEHRVHKVEMRVKETGEQEEELVVSNLRPFVLKVGVLDALDQPDVNFSLPLRAALLYENGLPVKQTSSSEPLLVGETDVVALQGTATFKLRITSLSSHRDKQRFRIQVAPQDLAVARTEPLLSVVTDPMKSVTKLGRAANPAMPPLPPPADTNGGDGLKRKYRETLEVHAQQIQHLQDTQQMILQELHSIAALAQRAVSHAGGQ